MWDPKRRAPKREREDEWDDEWDEMDSVDEPSAEVEEECRPIGQAGRRQASLSFLFLSD